MRKYKRLREESNAIDLTSLLDVIFILLLVVLLGLNTSVGKAQASADDFERRAEEYNSKKDEYEQLISKNAYVFEHIQIVNVSMPYSTDDSKNRTLHIYINQAEPIDIPISGHNTFKEELLGSIESVIRSSDGMPVVLSLISDSGKILFRDKQTIEETFAEVQKQYQHVFIGNGQFGGIK